MSGLADQLEWLGCVWRRCNYMVMVALLGELLDGRTLNLTAICSMMYVAVVAALEEKVWRVEASNLICLVL